VLCFCFGASWRSLSFCSLSDALGLLSMPLADLIKLAEAKVGVCLKQVELMTMGCVLCTDSGGRKLYVAGRLDSGDVFVERTIKGFMGSI